MRALRPSIVGVLLVAPCAFSVFGCYIVANVNLSQLPYAPQHITASTITGIDLDHHWTGRRDQYGNHFGFEGHLHEGRAVRPFYDVFFVTAH